MPEPEPKEPELYVPTATDLSWARQVISMIAHNGMLVYPSTSLTYTVDQTQHTLRLQNPTVLGTPGEQGESVRETHSRTRVVFAAIGWTVFPKCAECGGDCDSILRAMQESRGNGKEVTGGNSSAT